MGGSLVKTVTRTSVSFILACTSLRVYEKMIGEVQPEALTLSCGPVMTVFLPLPLHFIKGLEACDA